jgi:hypothetical protein
MSNYQIRFRATNLKAVERVMRGIFSGASCEHRVANQNQQCPNFHDRLS